jgi:hypothetical protein
VAKDLKTAIGGLGEFSAVRALNCVVQRLDAPRAIAGDGAAIRDAEAVARALLNERFPAQYSELTYVVDGYDYDQKGAMARAVLEAFAASEDTAVQNALQGCVADVDVPDVEPAEIGLFLLGCAVVALMQTRFNASVRRKDGKTEWSLDVGKEPTSEELLKKLAKVGQL